MSETCGAEHPEHPGTVCDRRPHNNLGFHQQRASGTVWEADPLPEAAPPTGKGALASMAVRTTRSGRTGDAADAVARWAATTKEEQG
ncbi:hypothetical protein [Streptomyces mirabilis]|uniref:hypothetical protein n=1 Tax=Streptomyces mirabilis TaxID=68239 RepID=UPI0036A1E0B2